MKDKLIKVKADKTKGIIRLNNGLKWFIILTTNGDTLVLTRVIQAFVVGSPGFQLIGVQPEG